ncbi:MAG: HAD family hydrolase [Caulobacteraceae bacterium]
MNRTEPFAAIVFDMDGLLIDSERVVRDAMIAIAAERGRELPDAVFLSIVGMTWEASRAIALSHFGPEFDLSAYDEEVEERVVRELEAGVILKSGVVEILDHLDALGMPRAVATSSAHAHVERWLGKAGILGRFDAIVARGDYRRGKPAADPYLAAAERLGVEASRCLALEDSHNGVIAAHAAGMATVMVPDLLPATEEIASLCRAVAASLHEVIDLLGSGPA